MVAVELCCGDDFINMGRKAGQNLRDLITGIKPLSPDYNRHNLTPDLKENWIG